ncbi:hypothetical protein D9758_009145 [Tetrapyrgos nigripes]|uniref:Ribosomal protein L22 n=1 Tax=Tetrapyrgos nigripes TaxID=182062 RepID=A0A8H5G8F9_9AGAR|nr:hypothetical protein D9758_009145 [Tetrapyrgos nigripes]
MVRYATRISKTITKSTPAPGKQSHSKPLHKFIIDYSIPLAYKVFDADLYEKFLHDYIKVDEKPGQLGDSVKIVRDAKSDKITIATTIHFSKRYLKYLTKKFLKKQGTRGGVRVISIAKDTYQLRFRKGMMDDDEQEEEDD